LVRIRIRGSVPLTNGSGLRKKSQNSRNLGFSYFFGVIIEGSGSVPRTNGSGSLEAQKIRIRLRNTAWRTWPNIFTATCAEYGNKLLGHAADKLCLRMWRIQKQSISACGSNLLVYMAHAVIICWRTRHMLQQIVSILSACGTRIVIK
jgi:hypothetical protein